MVKSRYKNKKSNIKEIESKSGTTENESEDSVDQKENISDETKEKLDKKRRKKNKLEAKEKKAREKEIKWNNLPMWEKFIKKALFIIGGLVISIFIGLVVCYIVNKDAITVEILKTDYGTEVSEAKRIMSVSTVSIEGLLDGETYNETYSMDMRLADDFYCSLENNPSEFYEYDFSHFYVGGEWVYVRRLDTEDWVKFKFSDFFGENVEPYMLFDTYYTINVGSNYELTKDSNHYYITQKISLENFLKFMGSDTISQELNQMISASMENNPNSFYVKNVYQFDRKTHALESVSFDFSEPLKQDEENTISIHVLIEYSTGTSQDFIVPTDIVESAEEINALEEFSLDEDTTTEEETTESITEDKTTESITEEEVTESTTEETSSESTTEFEDDEEDIDIINN